MYDYPGVLESKEKSDYVSRLEWEDGGVRGNVELIMTALLETPIVDVKGERKMARRGKAHQIDPSTTMSMRHKQVGLTRE